MRALSAGGLLLALLIGIALLVYLQAENATVVTKAGKQAQTQVREIAGVDENDAPVTDSINFAMHGNGGRFDGVEISSVTAGGSFDRKYGLQSGDIVTEIGPQPIRDSILITSDDSAKAMLQDAYQRSLPLTVRRGDARLTLPSDRFKNPAPSPTAANAGASDPGAAPPKPAPADSPAAPTGDSPAATPNTPAKPPKRPGNARGAAEDLLDKLGQGRDN